MVIFEPLFSSALRILYFHFLSNQMGYDRGDSFPFDFQSNGNPFGSKSKGNLSPRSYPIQFERKWNTTRFLSVRDSDTIVFARQWRISYARCSSTLKLVQ